MITMHDRPRQTDKQADRRTNIIASHAKTVKCWIVSQARGHKRSCPQTYVLPQTCAIRARNPTVLTGALAQRI